MFAPLFVGLLCGFSVCLVITLRLGLEIVVYGCVPVFDLLAVSGAFVYWIDVCLFAVLVWFALLVDLTVVGLLFIVVCVCCFFDLLD